MRSTVVLADVLLWFPAVFLFINIFYSSHSNWSKARSATRSCESPEFGISDPFLQFLAFVFIANQPALLLIDHGHFQYNSISLGLTLWAINFLLIDRDILGSIAFSLALNYKQMSLFHALAFFFYLLGKNASLRDPFVLSFRPRGRTLLAF